ncbi:hypothetical protein F5Y18DRAFT_438278 [Xylariaceae sp. FL1019]|nr:hypothetical protein F5Y18DRAFT_438278 [Xylariaceae sp. FL1019]
MVEGVMRRLLLAAGLENVDWPVFVLPEDYPFVVVRYEGVYTSAKFLSSLDSEDELAAFLAPVIARRLMGNVEARVAGGFRIFVAATAVFLSTRLRRNPIPIVRRWSFAMIAMWRVVFVVGLSLGLNHHRKEPEETDMVSLLLTAEAGFDPAVVPPLVEVEKGAPRFQRIPKSIDEAREFVPQAIAIVQSEYVEHDPKLKEGWEKFKKRRSEKPSSRGT